MRTLVAFSLLVAAALAEPQYFYSGGVVPQVGYGSYGGYYAGVVPVAGSYVGASPVVTKSVYPYAAPAVTPYVATVAYPSQDTSRGLPQPVQDTPEVKHAKAVFAKQYETAAVNAALGTVPVHSIHKRAAVLPVVPYKTPASTSPLVYSAVAAPVVGSQYAYNVAPYSAGVYSAPYSSPYGYGVAPYTTYY